MQPEGLEQLVPLVDEGMGQPGALWRGQLLDDPWLEPGAREMAHVKLRDVGDLDPVRFATWIARAKELETQSVA